MSVSDLLNEANAAFVDEDYERALASYSAALNIDDTNITALVKRSAVHLKLGDYTSALVDTHTAISLSPPDSPNAIALYNAGRARFSLKEFETARELFEKAEERVQSDPEAKSLASKLSIWISKCNKELPDSPPKKIAKTGSPSLSSSSTLNEVPACPIPGKNDAPEQNTEAKNPGPTGSATGRGRIKHDWYQTESHVIVSIMIKNVKASDISCDFGDASLGVDIKLPPPADGDYNLELDLFGKIIPGESNFSARKTKVEIKMKKSEAVRWSDLEGTGDVGVVQRWDKADGSLPAPYKSGKDWDKVDSELKEEQEKEKPEGEEALNELFKNIYRNASEETRKAMNKSFQESGGTVLSTNWDEIGSKKTEIQPPDAWKSACQGGLFLCISGVQEKRICGDGYVTKRLGLIYLDVVFGFQNQNLEEFDNHLRIGEEMS
eukprot:UC4_evm2s127